MSRPLGSLNVGVRFREGAFEMRCPSCTAKGVERYWPLTLEFWYPQRGMTACRACQAERHARRKREQYASDPAHRAKVVARNRERRRAARNADLRIKYRERVAALLADPEKRAIYLAKRAEASRRYRARRQAAMAAQEIAA